MSADIADIDGLLAEIENGRATFAAYADLAARLDKAPDEVMAAFNDIVSYERGQQILDACSKQPTLSKPLLERWLVHAHLFEAPRLQSYLCQLIIQLAEAETQRWQQRAHTTNQRLAAAAVKLAELEEVKARYDRLQSRYAQSAEGVAQVEAMRKKIKEMETIEAELQRYKTVRLPELEKRIKALESELQRAKGESERQAEEERRLLAKVEEIRNRQNSEWLRKLNEVVSYAERLKNPPRVLQASTDADCYQDLWHDMDKLREQLEEGKLRQCVERVYSRWTAILESKGKGS